MKKLILILLSLLIAAALFATGQPEGVEEVHELILVDTGASAWDNAQGAYDTGGYASFQEKIVAEFEEANPNVRVNYLHRDTT